MSDSLPYVNNYGQIPKLFAEIKKAAVPPKFNVDFLSSVLELKSSSYRAMIPFMKKLGFLDPANVPTQFYKDYRDDTLSKTVMASRVKEAYLKLFTANEYANKLPKDQLVSKVKNITGASDKDDSVGSTVGTFQALVSLSDFDASYKEKKELITIEQPLEKKASSGGSKVGISYVINLNLPATTEIEVFNAIFKSLKEHILDE